MRLNGFQHSPISEDAQRIVDLNTQRIDTAERIANIARRSGADRQEALADLQSKVMRMNGAQLTRLNRELSELWGEVGAEILGVIAALVVIILVAR
ncbi:MAG TPA: hypothetical protein VLE95_03010 [Chlamydiales bacterium]|nr:hypothetical protein [Chlamydiales bacterium]